MRYSAFALAAIAPLLSAAQSSCEVVTVYADGPSPTASVLTSSAASSVEAPTSLSTSFTDSSSTASASSSSPSAAANVASNGSSSSSSSSDSAFGFASGTTGGAGGEEVTVSTVEELVDAVKGDDPLIIYVEGTLEGTATIRTGSNKSILGKDSSSHIIGAGILVKGVDNVIIRNLKIGLVREEHAEDAIAIDNATNVWVDHCDLYSDLDHGKDYYDGLCDISHAADYVTVSNTHFHDHYKASLVGHDDGNGAEDTGYLHVTYANNLWTNIESRMPLLRFGTAHIYNSYFEGGESAVNTRMGAQALVESSVFDGVKDAVTSRFSKEDGYAITNDVDLGSASDKYPAPEGTLTSVPYEYELVGSGNVKFALEGVVGNTLTLG